MKAKPITLWLLVLCLFTHGGLSIHAQQAPSLPHAFFGTVEIAGQPAPVGAQVEARGQDVRTGLVGNPIEVSQVGQYGGAGGFDPKLVVQGSVNEGAAIEFYVNGVRAECAVPGGQWLDSYPFESGGVTELSLRAGLLDTPTSQATLAATATPVAVSPTSQATPVPTPTSQATLEATATTVAVSPTSQATPAPTPTSQAMLEATATTVAVPPPSPTSQAIPAATATGVEAQPTNQSALVPRATASSTVVAPSEPTLVPTLTMAATQPIDQTVVALIVTRAPTSAPKSPSGSSRGLYVGLVVAAVVIGAVVIATTKRRKNV